MESRISIITLGVGNLSVSYEFYKNGLGFETTYTPDKGIVFFKTQGTCFSIYPIEKLAEDVYPNKEFKKSTFPGFTLAHNVREKSDVDSILSLAAKFGAKIEKPAQDTFWGGYSGYFSDPDGYLWEIAWGAFEFNSDGSLIIT